MRIPFCEKDCQSCSRFTSAQCPGCAEGPGKPLTSDCSIATCARLKGIKFCTDCSSKNNCDHYADRHVMPRLREEKAQTEQKKREFSLNNASRLAGCFWALFALTLLPHAAEVLSIFKLPVTSTYLSVISLAVVGLILLKMGRSDLSYNTAGILALVESMIHAISLLLPQHSMLLSFLSPVSTITGLFRMYYMIHGHVETFFPLDRELSHKWDTLWQMTKWTLIVSAASAFLCIPFLNTSIGMVFGFILILCVVFTLVLSVIELVYLYRSAKIATACKKQPESEFSQNQP